MAKNANPVVSSEDVEFDELEALFGEADADVQKMEKIVLTQNLEGFASCFPDWDLHPPVK